KGCVCLCVCRTVSSQVSGVSGKQEDPTAHFARTVLVVILSPIALYDGSFVSEADEHTDTQLTHTRNLNDSSSLRSKSFLCFLGRIVGIAVCVCGRIIAGGKT
ncbi:AGAP009462-PA, partial [Anopheles gambiae str. PEST]